MVKINPKAIDVLQFLQPLFRTRYARKTVIIDTRFNRKKTQAVSFLIKHFIKL